MASLLTLAVVAGSAPSSRADEPLPPGSSDKPVSRDRDIADLSLEELVEVRVTPFDVSTRLDDGYRASNSVSGSRFDTPIIRLPFAIQAFTRTFIEDQKPVTVFDVAKYSPGVTYRSNDFNEGNANLAIRGFAVSSTFGNIQVLRDGVHGPSIFDFTNIERVEIVKGPASFLYGQLAPGGIVNLITKSPQAELEARAKVSYGSYGQYRVDVDLTGPVSQRLFYRLVASYDQDIHYWKPYDGHSSDIAPSLLWQPVEWLSVSAKLELFSKVESPQLMQKPGLAGVDVPGLPDDWNSMSLMDYRHSDTTSLNLAVDLKADDHWDLRASYAHLEYQVDALFSGNFGMSSAAPFMQGRREKRTLYANWGDTVEVDATAVYRFSFMSLRLLLGAQYVDRWFGNLGRQAPNAAGVGPIPSPLPNWDLRDPSTWDRTGLPSTALTLEVADTTTHYRDAAAYAGATVGFFDDRLLVLAGVRLTRTESELVDHLTHTVGNRFITLRPTPQVGLLYQLPFGLSAFATYSESFVPGSQILLVHDVPTTPAAPTWGRGVDVGVKAQLLGGRVSGTVTLFEVRNKNIVNDIAELDTATGRQVFTNVQSGEQRSAGVELDATFTPFDNWQTYVSYSYDHASIVEFSGHDAAILAGGPTTPGYSEVLRFHDKPLQMSAPHLANLWSRYIFTSGPLGGLFLAAGVNLVVQQTLLSDMPADTRQTYALVSATVGYSWQVSGTRLTLDVTGKNLADQRYRPSQSTRSRPRELLATLSIDLKGS